MEKIQYLDKNRRKLMIAGLGIGSAAIGLLGHERRSAIKNYLFNSAFALDCSLTDLQKDDMIERYPVFEDVYKKLREEITTYYNIDTYVEEALQGVLYRELFDFGFSPMCVDPVAEGLVKGTFNRILRRDNDLASFGYTNIKPVTIRRQVYELFPEAIKHLIDFDQEKQHADPYSLSRYLVLEPLGEGVTRSLWVSAAIVSSYDRRLAEAMDLYGYNDPELAYILETCYAGGEKWVYFFSHDDKTSWIHNAENHHLYDRRGTDRFKQIRKYLLQYPHA